MSELKKIPTFSWLVRKTEALKRKDPEAYADLRQTGTINLIRGCLVRMWCKDTGQEFVYRLYAPKNPTNAYASITGHQEGSEFYTCYKLEFTTTQYRKPMQRWLPVSFPNGVKCEATTPAVYFNADGTQAYVGHWNGGRRQKTGSPDCDHLIIRDRDGRLLADGDSNGAYLEERLDVIQNMHPNNPVDLWHEFIPGAVLSKLDWYKSMVPPQVDNHDMVIEGKEIKVPKVDEPVWNEMRVKTLAAKVHSEAIRLTKTYPHIKIAMIPGGPFGAEHTSIWHDDRMSRFSGGGSIRNPVVVGRDAIGEPFIWLLPELVLYWVASRSETNHKLHSEAQFIRIVIPPAGSRQLLRTDGKSSMTLTYRWGKKSERTLTSNVLRRGLSIERAHHQMLCYGAGNEMDGGLRQYGRHRHPGMNFGTHTLDSQLHNWDESQAVVVVHDKPAGRAYWENHGPKASKPEGIFGDIEERELIDCLPLC